MKIILLEDVRTLGIKGDIIEANDGYARNFILPKKLGIEATPKNLNDVKLQKANDERLTQEQLEAAQEYARLMETKTVAVKMKAGEGGKTFGSISSKEIATEAKAQHGLDIDKKKIQLADPIKNFGTYEVSVRIHPKVIGKLHVKVTEC